MERQGEDSGTRASPWLEGLLQERTAPLEAEIEVDAAVIGAGLTGLSTALALREQGLSVAVLEQAWAGFGASGRNAGHVTPWIGKDLPTLAMLFSRDTVRGLLALVEAAIANVSGLLERYRIDCDYEPVGNFLAAVHPAQYPMVHRAARAAERVGAPGEVLAAGELRRRGLPAAFRRAFFEPSGGLIHPGRFVRGLRRAAMEQGVRLYEGTPVDRIEQGEIVRLHTPLGRVRADRVVFATNAFSAGLGQVPRAPVRVYVYLFRTGRLSAAQLERIDWRGREGIYTGHEILESYRLTPDGRILGGSKFIRYGYGGRELTDDPRLFARLERAFRERFPELDDLPVADFWGGPIAFELDFLPALGRAGRHRNILYSHGYAGHGVALASYAGTMLADLAGGRDGPGRALWERRGIPLPPEPFRWLIVHALAGLFGAMDARIDRAVRRATAARGRAQSGHS
ncbi:MAG TPA: FAD-binding oxidoreductase [Gammaproteobacteria bacterium]|nr:FAD-binding oxidoreductase [Gammaproteobacteria bacterium]